MYKHWKHVSKQDKKAKALRHLGKTGLKIEGSTEGGSHYCIIYLSRIDLPRVQTPPQQGVWFLTLPVPWEHGSLTAEILVHVRRCPTETNCQTGSHNLCWLITLPETWSGERGSPLRFSNIPESHSFLWISCGQQPGLHRVKHDTVKGWWIVCQAKRLCEERNYYQSISGTFGPGAGRQPGTWMRGRAHPLITTPTGQNPNLVTLTHKVPISPSTHFLHIEKAT